MGLLRRRTLRGAAVSASGGRTGAHCGPSAGQSMIHQGSEDRQVPSLRIEKKEKGDLYVLLVLLVLHVLLVLLVLLILLILLVLLVLLVLYEICVTFFFSSLFLLLFLFLFFFGFGGRSCWLLSRVEMRRSWLS